MQLLFSILIFAFLVFSTFSKQSATLVSLNNDDFEEEEVQLIEEEEFEPSDDEGKPDEPELELDQDKMDAYKEEVEEHKR
jgi:hypothetical protein